MAYFLGIDTSNYKTSVALYDSETQNYISKTEFLKVESGSLGLRQSDALFQHVKTLGIMLEKLFGDEKIDICAIGVSVKPRSVEGSYMPCFLAGQMAAKAISSSHFLPYYEFSHQDGHIVSALFSANALHLLENPFYSFHLSGGTTEFLYSVPSKQNLFDTTIIGGTTDISAGQLVDRTGVMLGLDFPCGMHLEKICKDLEEVKGYSPKVTDGYFSLSGMENKVKKFISDGEKQEVIASFVVKTIWNTLKNTVHNKNIGNTPLIGSGGVLANKYLSSKLKSEFKAYIATPELSGDNAVGTAILASLKYGEEHGK